MKNETVRQEIESLDYYLQNHTNDYGEESHMAMMMAIKALDQTERIAKLVNELDLEKVLPKDFDNMFYLQSVKEIKEEMWRMYCFAEDVSYTLMEESEG